MNYSYKSVFYPQKTKQIIVRFKLKLNKYGILKRDPEIV